MERLIEKDQDHEWIKGHLSDSCAGMCEEVNGECWRCDIMVCMERLADYEDAEEQGKWAVFPKHYGEKIYEPCPENHSIIEWTIYGYQVDAQAKYALVGNGVLLNLSHLDYTFFRTREVAEAKLKEMEADNE